MEYATQIWSPYHVSLVDILETVQRGFKKRLHAWFLEFVKTLTVCTLPLQSLERCRFWPT